ncbi:MAG: hypothetical protein SGBAC_004586 [Bacillariaceae sp.]
MDMLMELDDGYGDWGCISDDESESDSINSYESIDSCGQASSSDSDGDIDADGLSTIIEETENDLISKCSHGVEASTRSVSKTRSGSNRSAMESPIHIPRQRISLDAFLKTEGRRPRSSNLIFTSDQTTDLDNTDSEPMKAEETFIEFPVHSFATQDDDVKSSSHSRSSVFSRKSSTSLNEEAKSSHSRSSAFSQKSTNSLTSQDFFLRSSSSSVATQGSDAKSVDSSLMAVFQKSCATLATQEMSERSSRSYATQGSMKSTDSSSTNGSYRLAKLKLKKSLSLDKLKHAIESTDLSSSFEKDIEETSKCINSMELALSKSPQGPRSSAGHQAAKNNLLNALWSVTKE